MKYSEMIPSQRSALNEREDIEWSNFWIDQANQEVDSRILLIGDSTSRMIRSTLAAMSGKPVDLLATSSGLHDSLFAAQMDCFFSSTEYRYDKIIVQLGHHAELGIGGGCYQESDWDSFQAEFSILIDFLQQFTNTIVVESIFYTVKPNKLWPLAKLLHRKEKFDVEVNNMKARKNDIMREIAVEKGATYLDINQFMLQSKKRYYHKDHIHYEKPAHKVIVAEMLRVLS